MVAELLEESLRRRQVELGATWAEPCSQMMQKQTRAGQPLDPVLSSVPGDVHLCFQFKKVKESHSDRNGDVSKGVVMPTVPVAWVRTQSKGCCPGQGYIPAGASCSSDLLFFLISKCILEEKGMLSLSILLRTHSSLPLAHCVMLGRLLIC